MNAIATRGTTAPALPPMPAPVQQYASALAGYAEARARWQVATPDEREGMYVGNPPACPALTDAERASAERAADAMHAHLQPINGAGLADWLRPVNLAVRNPQEERIYLARVNGMVELLNDLPRGAFTAEARRRLGGDFFPSAGEVRAAVTPDATRLRATSDALRVASQQRAEPVSPSRAERTPEEVAAVRAKVQEFMAARPSHEAPEDRKVAPAYLSDGLLLAQYEALAANGCAVSAFRAKALRQKQTTRARAAVEPADPADAR